MNKKEKETLAEIISCLDCGINTLEQNWIDDCSKEDIANYFKGLVEELKSLF